MPNEYNFIPEGCAQPIYFDQIKIGEVYFCDNCERYFIEIHGERFWSMTEEYAMQYTAMKKIPAPYNKDARIIVGMLAIDILNLDFEFCFSKQHRDTLGNKLKTALAA